MGQTLILETMPLAGKKVPEFNNEKYREIIYQNYRIVYQVIQSNNIEILSVIQGNQLIENILNV